MIYINKKNKIPYLKIGDNQYKNLHTEVSGEIKKDLVDKIFEESNDEYLPKAIEKNPLVLGLIKKLKLTINQK